MIAGRLVIGLCPDRVATVLLYRHPDGSRTARVGRWWWWWWSNVLNCSVSLQFGIPRLFRHNRPICTPPSVHVWSTRWQSVERTGRRSPLRSLAGRSHSLAAGSLDRVYARRTDGRTDGRRRRRDLAITERGRDRRRYVFNGCSSLSHYASEHFKTRLRRLMCTIDLQKCNYTRAGLHRLTLLV